MKNLIFAILIFPTISLALEHGCYTTNSNPYYCYSGSDRPDNLHNFAANAVYYGATVAYLLQDYDDLLDAANEGVSLLSQCVSSSNSYLNQLNSCTTNLDKSYALLTLVNDDRKKQIKLVSKLRKACGAKCKRIK